MKRGIRREKRGEERRGEKGKRSGDEDAREIAGREIRVGKM